MTLLRHHSDGETMSNMKPLLVLLVLAMLVITGCSHARVIVRDCQGLAGTDGQQNCELIQKLNS